MAPRPMVIELADDGCIVWQQCQTCPLVHCAYDDPHGVRRGRNHPRDQTIRALHHAGWSAAQLADRYGLTRRQIFRICAQGV